MTEAIENLGSKRAKARCVLLLFSLMLSPYSAFVATADTGGSVSGTVTDQTGAVVPDTTVTALNLDTTVQQTTRTNSNGAYTLTNLPVGRYEIEIIRDGFKPYKRTGLVIDINAALREDVTLTMGEQSEEVVVSDSAVHVETESSQMGEVVTGTQITAVALNGRSFTDLLALQPGIVPMSTQQPDSIVMAGASVAIAPSGGLNAGNQSISGQREDANGFVVNGGDVKELMNGGTSIVPNLDSIAEFRVLTNNFDAEYGNYSGGIVNVVTKSGTNGLHGSAFEFLRNTALDAKNFFSSERAKFNQSQFGGTLGGPIAKNKIFFFGDYQGTRTREGIDTGLISVPSATARTGNLLGALTGSVSGPYLANLLSQELGYPVTAGEAYASVFPGGVIPQAAWSAPSTHLLAFIPSPNSGTTSFSSGSGEQKLRDDKMSARIDANTERWGTLSAYYFYDHSKLDNPYPTGQGGASVPGFSALNLGTAQLVNLGQIKSFGNSAVNEIHLSFMRSANNVGQPVGGVGPTLASQGFDTNPATFGILPLAPSIEGIENVVFNSFVMGTPITNLVQVNNTFSVMDNFSKILGSHSIKAGLELSYEQINVNPNPTFNGSFQFTGSETGSDFADFLIGVASNFNQADSMSFYGRHKYASAFAQDTWRITPRLTLNYGLRWELMQYWSEKYNQIPTFALGEQSKVYPGAPIGLVYPGDPGVPNTLVPERNRFAPRFGLAYTPKMSNRTLGKILGQPGKTSLRAGYGIFYSVIQGNTIAIDEPQPPYGLSYTGQGVLFPTPFINAATGQTHVNPFPLKFPPFGASASHPNPIDFSPFLPLAGMTAPPPGNTFPYAENYFLSIERQLGADTVLSFSYVGSEAHHLLVVYSANPGNPALCLSLSQPLAVAPGTPTCGPFGENNVYTTASNQTISGTRGPLGPAFANDDYDSSIGNSNYNSFEADVRHSGKRLNFSVGYTFSKSVDQASSLSDIVDPFNFSATRSLSAWDLKHNLVLAYAYQLPLERLSSRAKLLTQGWSVSGITRLSSGFPVTISEEGDNSLMGSQPNGVNNHSLDLPDFTPGPLDLNSSPRNGQAYFNTSLFGANRLGTPGNSSRRFFYGPAMFNTDLALLRSFRVSETKALQFRLETFNTFNRSQFFGPASVNGDFSSPLFGKIVKAMPPRLVQVALKYTF